MSRKMSFLSKYGSESLTSIQCDYENEREPDKKDKKKRKKKSKKKTDREIYRGEEKGAMTSMQAMDEMDPVPPSSSVGDGFASEENFDGVADDDEDGPTLVELNSPSENGNEKYRGRKHYSGKEVNDAELKRRRVRHDSDEDNPRLHNSDHMPRSKTTRRHNESERDIRAYRSKGKRTRHDSDDDCEFPSKGRRRRHDSDDNESWSKERRRRHDSESSSSPSSRRKNSRVRRHDSDEESDDSYDRSEGNSSRAKKMSSGHSAGLQSNDQFRKAEASLQKRRREGARNITEQNAGGANETVYRDKHGRRFDVNDEISRHQKSKKGKIEIDEEEQLQWGKGRAQIQAEEQAMKEAYIVQSEAFARTKDDSRLDQEKRELIRKGDPMAAQAYKRQTTLGGGHEKIFKKTYKGPEPNPNRFAIRPGYRWDGVDRGNGFEEKVLAHKYSKHRKKEEAYRWSSADM